MVSHRLGFVPAEEDSTIAPMEPFQKDPFSKRPTFPIPKWSEMHCPATSEISNWKNIALTHSKNEGNLWHNVMRAKQKSWEWCENRLWLHWLSLGFKMLKTEGEKKSYYELITMLRLDFGANGTDRDQDNEAKDSGEK